jgi:maleylacetoacetate isomerase
MEGWMQHFIALGFQGFEGLLSQAPEQLFCHGSRPGLADICLVPQVYNAHRWGVDLTPFPRLAAINARAEALPAFVTAHPDRVKS